MKWYPIETAPKDGTLIDLVVKGKYRLTGMWWDKKRNQWVRNDTALTSDDTVTHWSPIPDMPYSLLTMN